MNLEIGVIEKQSEPAFPPPGTVAASNEFASRVAGQYLPGELTVSRAELALAYDTGGDVNHFGDTNVNVSPRFSVDHHYLFAPVRREIAAGHGGAPEAHVERLYQRLFSRQERVKLFAAGEPGRRGQNEIQPLAGFSMMHPEPVERTVRATSSEDRAAKPVLRPGENSDFGWGTPITPPVAQKPVTLAAAEVKRVTEQVIREIDHRILARRERMGRR